MGSFMSAHELKEIGNSLGRKRDINMYVTIYNTTLSLYYIIMIVWVLLVMYLVNMCYSNYKLFIVQ